MADTDKNTVNIPDSASDNNLEKNNVIKQYITGRKKKEVFDELKKGYKEMAAVNLEWAETCLVADNDCQREYEEKLSECE
ncbi:MAG: hypothetical protein IKV86_01360 [Clostridia bacterium]|nr:hypothetical protein [Clostridia bacterium]